MSDKLSLYRIITSWTDYGGGPESDQKAGAPYL